MARTATNPQTGETVQWDDSAGQWVPMEDAGSTSTQPAVLQARGSLLDPLMQGLTFGWGEELGGAGAQIGSLLAGAPYARAKRAGQAEMTRQRERLADVRERMPWTSLGLEAGGALVSGGPVLKGAETVLRGAGLSQVAAPMAAAGIEGSVAGAGAADENRLLGATLGAGLGAGTASALPAIAAGGRAMGERAAPYVRKVFESPPTTAGRVMSETLQAAGETPTAMKARQRQLGPQATLADISGPAGQGLAQGVVQADPTGQALIAARRELAKRAAGATKRIKTDLEDITGIEQRLQPTLDAVRTRQKAASSPAYAMAYQQEIPLTSKLKNLLNRPPMQKAWNEARDSAATRGEELPPWFQMDEFGDWQKNDVMPDMQSWDRMKQGIDRMIESETDAVTGRVTPQGRDLSTLKRELVNELDEINPMYKSARQAFAGDEAIQNAMRDGERFLNMKTREVESAVNNMTNSEKEAFLTGAMESVREKMGRARSGEIGEFRFMETGNIKEKLRTIFPKGREGDRMAAQLNRMLDRERTFATTQGQITGGSQTALRQAAGESLKSGASMPTSLEMLTSPLRGTAQAALSGAGQAMSGIGRGGISELGGMMFDPNQINRAIAEMQRRGIPPASMSDLMARYARGGARVSPLLGLGAGEMTNQ